MTTPTQRLRALVSAGDLLRELQHRDDVPIEVREQVSRILRHYPEGWMIDMIAREWQEKATPWLGLAPE